VGLVVRAGCKIISSARKYGFVPTAAANTHGRVHTAAEERNAVRDGGFAGSATATPTRNDDRPLDVRSIDHIFRVANRGDRGARPRKKRAGAAFEGQLTVSFNRNSDCWLESCWISTIRHRPSPNHLSALIRAKTSSRAFKSAFTRRSPSAR
jgi:hypothetical protein